MDDKVPTTPPAKVPPLSPGEMPTVIVKADELPTPKIYIERLERQTILGKRNLQTEFENAGSGPSTEGDLKNTSKEDARSKKVGLALEEIQNRAERQYEKYLKRGEEYQKRVDETAKMTLKLPAKKQKTEGGRKSNRKNKKHRKKTSKKRRSRK